MVHQGRHGRQWVIAQYLQPNGLGKIMHVALEILVRPSGSLDWLLWLSCRFSMHIGLEILQLVRGPSHCGKLLDHIGRSLCVQAAPLLDLEAAMVKLLISHLCKICLILRGRQEPANCTQKCSLVCHWG